MTAAHLTVAHCGEVSALTLGLPASAAIPEQKGTLPKGLFVAKAPVSSKLKQRLVNDIASRCCGPRTRRWAPAAARCPRCW